MSTMDKRIKLSELELANALATLPQWERDGASIQRELQPRSFTDAAACVFAIAKVADAREHHPDIRLSYGRLRFSLTTHDVGGLTQLDIDLAQVIDAIADTPPEMH